MRAVWTILAVLAFAFSGQATELTDKVQEAITEFLQIIPTGSVELDIPVLDPLNIAGLNLNLDLSLFKGNLALADIKVTGLSNLNLVSLEQGEGSTVNVGVNLPDLDVVATYTIDGRIKLGLLNVNLKGSGDLTVKLGDLNAKGSANMVENSDGSLNVASIDAGDWSYGSLKVNLNGLALSSVVNSLLNAALPSLISSNKDKIDSLVEVYGPIYLNKYLNKVNGASTRIVMEPITFQVEDWVIPADVEEIFRQIGFLTLAHQIAQQS